MKAEQQHAIAHAAKANPLMRLIKESIGRNGYCGLAIDKQDGFRGSEQVSLSQRHGDTELE